MILVAEPVSPNARNAPTNTGNLKAIRLPRAPRRSPSPRVRRVGPPLSRFSGRPAGFLDRADFLQRLHVVDYVCFSISQLGAGATQ
jgi:hypothetical protein